MDYAKEAIRDLRDLLERAMVATGMNQRELAAHVEKDPSQISKLLAGKRSPNLSTLAEVFGAMGYQITFGLKAVKKKDAR